MLDLSLITEEQRKLPIDESRFTELTDLVVSRGLDVQFQDVTPGDSFPLETAIEIYVDEMGIPAALVEAVVAEYLTDLELEEEASTPHDMLQLKANAFERQLEFLYQKLSGLGLMRFQETIDVETEKLRYEFLHNNGGTLHIHPYISSEGKNITLLIAEIKYTALARTLWERILGTFPEPEFALEIRPGHNVDNNYNRTSCYDFLTFLANNRQQTGDHYWLRNAYQNLVPALSRGIERMRQSISEL